MTNNRVTKVAPLAILMRCLNCDKKVCEIVAEQTNICESAVDMHAEKMPANMMPTKNVGNVFKANNGRASSVSWFINSGSKTRAASPTKIAAIENVMYHEKYKVLDFLRDSTDLIAMGRVKMWGCPITPMPNAHQPKIYSKNQASMLVTGLTNDGSIDFNAKKSSPNPPISKMAVPNKPSMATIIINDWITSVQIEALIPPETL